MMLITGHEAEMSAIKNAVLRGEFFTIKVSIGGRRGTTLAHSCLPLGRQSDGSIILLVETFRRWAQSRQDVIADVLLTTFLPRAPNWVEDGGVPEWRVACNDCKDYRFGAGQICNYWNGLSS